MLFRAIRCWRSNTSPSRVVFERLSLDERLREQIGAILETLTGSEQARLIESMEAIQAMLDVRPDAGHSYLLRSHQPGEMGWIVQCHGQLYAQEYGWNEQFQSLVAGCRGRFSARPGGAAS